MRHRVALWFTAVSSALVLALAASDPAVAGGGEEEGDGEGPPDGSQLEIEAEIEDGGDLLKIEAEHLPAGAQVELIITQEPVSESLATLTTNSEGGLKLRIDTRRGDVLPLGVASVADLAAARVDLLDGSGQVLASGVVPAAERGEDDGSRVSFLLDDVEARVGQRFTVPFRVDTNRSLALTALSVEFDPEAIRFEEPPVLSDDIRLLVESVPPEDFFFSWFVDNEEGWVQVLLVTDYRSVEETAIPPAGTLPVVDLDFRLQPDASPGNHDLSFTVRQAARFEGHFESFGLPVYNVARLARLPFSDGDQFDDDEDRRDPSLDGGTVLAIVGDVGAFLRGDANLDQQLNLADPMTILMSLFRGGGPVPCWDAADANVDNRLDLADPITILRYLFVETTGPLGSNEAVNCPLD